MTPSSAETDVVSITSPIELIEVTSTLNAPDAALLVEQMRELVASEATALLGGEREAEAEDAANPGGDAPATERLADLQLRIALASWDVLHQPAAALSMLELADSHPLALRLRAMATIDDPEQLAKLPPATGALAIEIAEAWLWRHGDPARAGDLADRLLAGDLPSVWRVHVAELAILAHGARANWPRVVELCTGGITDRSPPEDIAATAALLIDRGDDPRAALELCWRKLASFLDDGWDAEPSTSGWLRCLDVALDAAVQLGDHRVLELLAKRAELITGLPAGEPEALATRLAIAAELDARRASGEAAEQWAELADAAALQAPGTLRCYARLRATWSGAAANTAEGRAIKLTAHRRLADTECAEVAATHAWRALELAAASGDPTLGDTARAVVDVASSRAAERWLDMVDVAAPSPTTLARFSARGGLALRWAAAIAERNSETTLTPGHAPTQPLALWRRAAAEPDALPTTRDHLARLLRGGEADELSATYHAWADAEPDGRAVAALWCACGVVDLARGDLVEAEDALRRAATFGRGDAFCRAALAQVYRTSKRHDQLAPVLAELAAALASKDARTAAARERAELLDQQLGDAAGARAAFERLIADHPGDAEPILALARLCERDALWDRAIQLRQRAAELATTPARRAEIWRAVARDEERRGGAEAALAALGKAAEAGDPTAVREQARLHRAAGRSDRALDLVRGELAGDPPLARRMQLQAQLAQLLTELDREPETVVAAYLDVLSIEPDQTEALVGIERPARALGLWDELARAFRGAPQTARNLEVLAEALEHIAEWSELAEVRRRQLEAATTSADKARRAGELARLYEHELGDLDAAARMLAVAQQAEHDDARQQVLLRILRDGEKWPELATALERELANVRSADVERQVAILLELGELRKTRLGRASDAAQAYEGVVERRPGHPAASAELEQLYDQLGSHRELARLLEVRAEAETGAARGPLFARVAALRAQRNDTDGAIAAYLAAFTADPTSREVFTAMERVAYKAERWAAAMQLYDIAIHHVETGASRAYRLGDLYARRGNVQLNFLGEPEAAIASLQKVVEVDSQPDAAIKTLEELCRRRNDWQPLIIAYERRAETQRDAQRKIGALRKAAELAHDHATDARDSVRIRRKLLDADPGDLGAASQLERFYEDNQDPSGLIEVLKLRLQHAEGQDASVELHRRIAQVSEEGARDVDTATEHYHKILELEPENKDALEALGRIYESTERWAELIEITRKQIKVTTDRTTRGLLYFRCGSVMEAKFSREHDAIRYYDAAIKTSPACLPAVHGLRDLYRRREEWPRVIETLELEVKLWQDDKERAGVFAQIGRIYDQQLGDDERAMRYYESALEVDPDCLPANQAMFEHFFAAGDWDKAQPIATSLAQKAMRDGDPSTRSEFYRKRGLVAQRTGDPRAAAESFVVALEIKPSNGEALDDLGALARERPDVWEFDATYRELEKVYKKRDDAGPLLARVHVGRAAIRERDGDLDQAAELYRLALELGPGDFTVLAALITFHTDMRHWPEALAAIQQFVTGTAASTPDRIAALMRQAEIHADGELDTARAIAVLRTVIELEPSHQDGYYTLAQQYYLSARYTDARAAIDRVIELATAPGQPLSPAALARYYYYKGRILDAAGDPRAAAPQYRRAIEYDPGYAPPALVLARRAAETGDQRQAEVLLIDAAHAAMARGGPRAAVPLQRGLARILLGSGDRPAAIEAYRGILNVEPDGASDRVALAEIYAVDDPPRAIGELRKVLERDIHHAPAYRLLASFYARTGDTERANRVLTALDLLGFAEDTDRTTMQRLKAARVAAPLRTPLDDDARTRLLLTPAAREPLGEVFDALAQELSTAVIAPSLGENLVPAVSAGDPRVVAIGHEIAALFEVEVEIFVGENVPGLAAVTAFPRRLLVIDRSLLAESDPALRFLFGYALEAIRGGYATLLQLGARQRRELGNLLRAVLAPEPELTGSAAELLGNISEHAQQVLERHAGVRDVDPGAWIDGMLACAKRAGLVACDDFHAAIWTVALLAGEKLSSHHATIALGSVLGGTDLVRFYLSDPYQLLRDRLTA
ncbi:MAG TPA: tetratricopeptide repeat protein [Kofleriaceae bacterium]|nr:tetratricopeptide repeat protein [Kofleriaceae bacterium]